MTNRSTRPRLTVSRGIHIQEGIRIERASEDVFDFWRDLPNLPRFMEYVDRVDLRGDGVSHWVVKGPGGVTLEWDAHFTNEQRPRLLAWESIDSEDVYCAGSVKFTSLGAESTDVEVQLQYDPPAGLRGVGTATMAGLAPATVLREDLRRLKQLLESHAWRTVGAGASEVWMYGRGGA